MSDTPRPWWQSWTVLAPPIALVVLVLTFGDHIPAWLAVLLAVVLGGAVLAAVHHAEVVAHRVGEPFGSLVLAVAVTVIEVALIVTLMISGESGADSLARDTVFAAVMITTNGIVGISLLTGALRFGVAVFNPEGTGAALATVAALSALSLVLPTFTSSPGPEFSPPQLSFAALASIALYAMFVSTQTGRHRASFLPVPTGAAGVPTTATVPPAESGASPASHEQGHQAAPSARAALLSLGLLLVALVDVVGLAKVLSHSIESAVKAAGAPPSFVGVVIALLVLAPETLAAVRAARREQVQISLNLGYGSAMASIGLTIPSIAVATIWLKGPLLLGLGATQVVLLAAFVFLAIKP